MIKISANLSKKVPMKDTQYSSQQFGGSIEVEVGETDSADAIHEKMRRLYLLLSRAVDEQISKTAKIQSAANGSGNGNGAKNHAQPSAGRFIPASDAQKMAIYAISKRQGLDPAQFGMDQLSIKDASTLIDRLKNAAKE